MTAHPQQLTHTQQLFRNAMSTCAAGVHVITTDGTHGRYGITMTAVVPITDKPPTVMLSINKRAAFLPILQANCELCINVLAGNQQDLAEHFAGMTELSPEERFQYHIWHRGRSGQLQVQGALAYLHGHVSAEHSVGTHQVFYVEIDEIQVSPSENRSSLVYFQRHFHDLR